MLHKRFSILLIVLVVLGSVALVVSNIIAGKLWAAPFGLILTTAELLFPIVYIVGDVIPEVYGLQVARRAILIGFAANLFAVVFFLICLQLPAPGFWTGQEAFKVVLGFTPRLLVGSFIAYLIGSNVNAWTLVKIKELTGTRFLWIRTIGSTIVGEGVDSFIFAIIAFTGVIPFSAVIAMSLSTWAFKTSYEALATPLTYLAVNWVKKVEASI